MFQIRVIFLLTLFSCTSCAQAPKPNDPVIKEHVIELGASKILVTEAEYAPVSPFVFVGLHDNEETAAEAASVVLKERGGRFISIENNRERFIDFLLNDKTFRFDPNRIFTDEGRRKTLKVFKNEDTAATEALGRLSSFILQLIPDTAVVIAVHNNTSNEYSITRYRRELKDDAAAIHINPAMDPDDFVFTTDKDCFNYIKSRNWNVVLQDNRQVTDDGSMSVYFGKKGLPYINIEAEYGHLEQQLQMIRIVLEYLSLK